MPPSLSHVYFQLFFLLPFAKFVDPLKKTHTHTHTWPGHSSDIYDWAPHPPHIPAHLPSCNMTSFCIPLILSERWQITWTQKIEEAIIINNDSFGHFDRKFQLLKCEIYNFICWQGPPENLLCIETNSKVYDPLMFVLNQPFFSANKNTLIFNHKQVCLSVLDNNTSKLISKAWKFNKLT